MAKNSFEGKMVGLETKALQQKKGRKKEKRGIKALEEWRPPTRESLMDRGDYAEARTCNEEVLSEFDDDAPLVVQTDINFDMFTATAGELRHELMFMEDEKKGRAHGWPYYLMIISHDPKEFAKKEQERLERSKDKYLGKLAVYADDQLIWIVYPNQSGSCHQTTAGQMRRMLEDYDASLNDNLSHLGGFIVVSTDPDFDVEAFNQKNQELHEEMVRAVADYVNAGESLRETLIKRLHEFKPDTRFRVTYVGEPEGRLMTGKELEQEIFSVSLEILEARGLPKVEPMTFKKELKNSERKS